MAIAAQNSSRKTKKSQAKFLVLNMKLDRTAILNEGGDLQAPSSMCCPELEQ